MFDFDQYILSYCISGLKIRFGIDITHDDMCALCSMKRQRGIGGFPVNLSTAFVLTKKK